MKDDKTADAIEELITTYVEGVKRLIDINVAGIKTLQKDLVKLEKTNDLSTLVLETRTSKNQLKKIADKLDTLEIKPPDVNIEVPEIKIPQIDIPKIEAPKVEVKTTEKVVKFPKRAKDAVPVRLSDGKKFYRAIENIATFPAKFGGGGGEFAYMDSQGSRGYGLTDSDRHVQVDVLTTPADVVTIEDSTTNIDGKDGIVTNSVMYGRVSDTKFLPLKIDPLTQSIQTVDYEHHEIHSGSHYYISDAVDQAQNAVFDLQFTTPNTTKWIHFTYNVATESQTEIFIYEGASIDTAGTSVTPINNNRNSSSTSGVTAASIINSSVANANSDTPVAAATEIEHQVIAGGQRSGGANERGRELILKQNTIYCMRAVSLAAGWVTFTAEWYEHTDAN